MDADIAQLVGTDAAGKLASTPILDLDAMTDRELQGSGLSLGRARKLRAAFELGRKLMVAEADAQYGHIAAPEDAWRYFAPRFVNLKVEEFHVAFLDTKCRVLSSTCISRGSLTASIVHPREVFKPAIRESAASVIFAHNHPSGDPRPSREDVEITHRLQQVGEIVGIKVADHVVIGANKFFSFSREGLL